MLRFLAITLLAASAPFAGALDRAAYVPSTIIDAVAKMEILPDVQYFFDAAHPRFRLVATFKGERRPITPERLHYMEMWVKSFRHPDSYLKLFQSEVRIDQDDKSYWMPIQQTLIEVFDTEVAAGAQVELYATAIGAWKQDPIFLVNAFEAR